MKSFILFLLSIQIFGNIVAQDGIPKGANVLLKAYPATIKDYKDGKNKFNDYEYITPVLINKDNVDKHYDKDSIF